jgi:hypothetical protein
LELGGVILSARLELLTKLLYLVNGASTLELLLVAQRAHVPLVLHFGAVPLVRHPRRERHVLRREVDLSALHLLAQDTCVRIALYGQRVGLRVQPEAPLGLFGRVRRLCRSRYHLKLFNGHRQPGDEPGCHRHVRPGLGLGRLAMRAESGVQLRRGRCRRATRIGPGDGGRCDCLLELLPQRPAAAGWCQTSQAVMCCIPSAMAASFELTRREATLVRPRRVREADQTRSWAWLTSHVCFFTQV